jgi:hypothetical protein
MKDKLRRPALAQGLNRQAALRNRAQHPRFNQTCK